MKWLAQVVFNNWWLKLLSLGLAWLLWSAVTQGPLVETGMLVSFGVRQLSQELQVEGALPTPVYIQLRGPERLVQGLQPGAVSVTVDLSGETAGEKEIVLEAEDANVPPGIEVVGFVPERVRLKLVMKRANTKDGTQDN